MRSGTCSTRLRAVPRTVASASFSSPTYPTPLTSDAKSGSEAGHGRNTLQLRDIATRGLWPTPTVCGNYNRPYPGKESGTGLEVAVRLLPTPTVTTFTRNRSPGAQERLTLVGMARSGLWPASRRRRSLRSAAESCGHGEIVLITALARLTPPAPAQRLAVDTPTRALARQLLAVPLEGLAEADAHAAICQRYDQVLATATAFAAICEAEPDQRRFWCGAMLELRGRRARDDPDGPRARSRWSAVELTVGNRQAAREAVAAATAAAQKVAVERQAQSAAEETKRPTAAGLDAGLRELSEIFRQRGAG